MDRYQNLDLDLECDGGRAAQKTVFFKGMFKRSSKSREQSEQAQDSLSTDSELSLSDDSLTDGNNTKNKGRLLKEMFRKTTKAAKEDQPQVILSLQHPQLSASSDSLTDSNKSPKIKSSAKLKQTPKPGQDLLDNTLSISEDSLSENTNIKQSGVGFIGMMKKLSKPFGARTKSQDDLSAPSELSGSSDNLSVQDSTKKDSADTVTLKDKKEVDKKPKLVKSNVIQQKTREGSESPPVPVRPNEEEMMQMSTCEKVKPTEDNQQSRTDDEVLKENSTEAREGESVNAPERKTVVSNDEWLKAEELSSSKEEKKEEEAKEKTEETKVKKPRRHNPFMAQVKAKIIQQSAQDRPAGSTAENEGGNRSLFDQLDDFCIEPEDRQDVENLMDWWNTVESWEDTPQDDDMTEKEEAKAFAVTADKVQKGIRVFNKLFSERAESLWKHVIDLHSIADGLDKFNKNTKIAQITGGSTSAVGGIATIAGLALAPVTLGTSLIVTAVGLGVATAGGLTSAGAGISNQVNNSMDRKKVEKLVEDYQEKILDLNKCLKFIQQGIENLRKFDLIKMKKHAYNRDFPVLSSSLYEDGAMAGKAILSNANEIMRVVQIAHVAGSTAARAVQVASMATGVLTGLFVGMDIYFVAKDSKELKKGAKSEFAAKIREVATQLHDGLVELNRIRVELQCNTQENKPGRDQPVLDRDKKQKTDKDEDEDDEISRVKKAMKKDMS
uniref:Apolipoprotein L, 1 n=1 Tax=Anabas testudineus TaxID=64144 RepID=A0A3Q1IU58_ANATE